MKADRLLSVLMLLQAKGRATERELAEQLEVSQRTIHRDLESLSAARVPVVALRGSQGGWELEKGWRTQVPALDEAELRALLMAQPRAVGHPRLAAAAESALNKLMAALPGPMRAQAAAMRERLHVDATGWRETGEDLSMLAIVQDAVARERRLAFDYTKADGEKAPRTVDPLGLVAKGLSWYLVARGANGIRTYRVSRMEAATVLASGFERPARFDLAEYWKKSTAEFDQQRRRYAATLLLTAHAARRMQKWFATTAAAGNKSIANSEDRMTLRVEFAAETEARFIVLGFGTDVEVIEPKELRQWVHAEARSISEQAISQSVED
ncbi:MAG: helix-turn-helix transcriptional regulator [Terracidiphilus sp.]